MILVFIKSTIILMTAAFAAWMCRRQSAALKHAIWTAGLIGALAVPMCGLLLPVWRVPAPIDTIPVLEELPLPAAPAFSEVSEAKVAKSMPAHSAASTPWRLGRIVVLVWIGGAAIGLAIMFSGAAALAFVAIRAERLDDSRWATMSAEIASSLNMKRRAQLLQNRAASLSARSFERGTLDRRARAHGIASRTGSREKERLGRTGLGRSRARHLLVQSRVLDCL